MQRDLAWIIAKLKCKMGGVKMLLINVSENME